MFVKRILSFLLAAVLTLSLSATLIPSISAAELYDDSTPIPVFSSIEVIDGGVRFSWEPFVNRNCPSGVFYRVYYKNYRGEWIRMITTGATQFVDTDVHIGRSFDYTIRCVTPDGRSFASDCDTSGWLVAYYDAPIVTCDTEKGPELAATGADQESDEAITDPTGVDTSGIKDTIRWSGDAPAYRVYRKRLDQPDPEVICEATDALSCTVEQPDDKAVYAYEVCALDSRGDIASACGVTPYYTDGSLYCTPNRWIYALLCAKFDDVAEKEFEEMSDTELSDTAREYGALTPTDFINKGDILTRRFVADTLVNLFGYSPRALANSYQTAGNSTVDFIKEDATRYYAADTADPNLNTVAYYGWFEPDSYNRLYLWNEVTADEWDHLMNELSLYHTWHGKTVISFGDSGIQGLGNIIDNGDGSNENSWRDINRKDFVNKRFPRTNTERMEGPVEFIGEKYNMNHRDYSWSGATMGTELERSGADYIFTNYASYKSHIANQIRTANKEGQNADLIIMNGGDNDEYCSSIPFYTQPGQRNVYDWGYSEPSWFSTAYHRDYHVRHPEYFHYGDQKVLENYTAETSFVAGTKTAFSLLQENYPSTPVIYVRSHEINFGSIDRQRIYQEKLLSIAANYGITAVDLFNRTDLDGCNRRMVAKYCYDGYYADGSVVTDGIHPNGLGYTKYYLPFIEEAMLSL